MATSDPADAAATPVTRVSLTDQARRAAKKLGEGDADHSPLPFQPTDHYSEIPIDRISPATDGQVRKDFDEGKLRSLAENLRQIGMQEPIVVRPSPAKDGTFVIIAGERRWRAAGMAGFQTVPCMVRVTLDKAEDNLLAQVSENVHREDLNPVEEAEALVQLMDQRGIDVKEAGALMGRTYIQARRLRRIHNAPLIVKAKLRSQELSLRVAVELLRIYNSYVRENPSGGRERATAKFETLVDRVIREGWSRKAVEAFATKIGAAQEGDDVADDDGSGEDRTPVGGSGPSQSASDNASGGDGPRAEEDSSWRLFDERDGRVTVFRERLKRPGVSPEQRSALIELLDTMVMEARRAR